eukprot:6435583-Lingulodinium_polyedra.AAC.1
MRINPAGVEASIKPAIFQDLTEQVRVALNANVPARKKLLSLAGRASHVSTLLWAWRPFCGAPP